jgi:hypothetical protein
METASNGSIYETVNPVDRAPEYAFNYSVDGGDTNEGLSIDIMIDIRE